MQVFLGKDLAGFGLRVDHYGEGVDLQCNTRDCTWSYDSWAEDLVNFCEKAEEHRQTCKWEGK